MPKQSRESQTEISGSLGDAMLIIVLAHPQPRVIATKRLGTAALVSPIAQAAGRSPRSVSGVESQTS